MEVHSESSMVAKGKGPGSTEPLQLLTQGLREVKALEGFNV